MNSRKLILLILFAVIIILCSLILYSRSSQKGALITTPGIFISPSQKLDLVVHIKNDNVFFEIRRVDGQAFVSDRIVGSKFERWLFLWDKNDWLWVYGEQIAAVVIPNGSGSFDIKEIEAAEIRTKMPQTFREGLPQSWRKLWGI